MVLANGDRAIHSDGLALYDAGALATSAGARAQPSFLDDTRGNAVRVADLADLGAAAVKQAQHTQHAQLAQRAQQAQEDINAEEEEEVGLVEEAADGGGHDGPSRRSLAAAAGGDGAASGGEGPAVLLGDKKKGRGYFRFTAEGVAGAVRPPRMSGVYLGAMENKGGFFPIRDKSSKWCAMVAGWVSPFLCLHTPSLLLHLQHTPTSPPPPCAGTSAARSSPTRRCPTA